MLVGRARQRKSRATEARENNKSESGIWGIEAVADTERRAAVVRNREEMGKTAQKDGARARVASDETKRRISSVSVALQREEPDRPDTSVSGGCSFAPLGADRASAVASGP